MKRIFPLLLLLAIAEGLSAQPWLPKNGERMKFDDIVARYQRVEVEKEGDLVDENGRQIVEEDENYHFDRWKWYWEQHLDTNGYMVSKAVAQNNWNEYISAHKPQNSALKTSIASNWQFEGPSTSGGGYSGVGRVNVVGFDPVDSNTLYVGSAGGSAWKTSDGGNTWKCLYDHMFSTGVSDIKVNPMNRNTVYIVTGDADAGDNYSVGVIKSYDGGATLTNIGPFWTPDSLVSATSFLINPLDTNEITLGSFNGLYKSHDGGGSWIKISSHKIRQLLYNVVDTAIVYATIDGGSSAQIMQSTDGGYTWGVVTAFTNAKRINIAVTQDAPHVVRALVAKNGTNGLVGIYSSGDYGVTYLPVYTDNSSCDNNLLSSNNGMPSTTCSGQGWYDLCIANNPADANKIIIGGIVNYYSVNGGASWDIVNQWWNEHSDLKTVHADKHWLGYSPLNGALYMGCDGGIYKTYNPNSKKWIDLSNGLGITQFYRNAVANGVDYCLGGAQDNGTKRLEAGSVTDLTGGDGMVCLIDYSSPEFIFYTSTQKGNVNITYDAGANYSSITSDLPKPGAWITPFVIHPTSPNILFIGYKKIFKSINRGVSWAPLSPNFSSTNILHLAVAPSDPDYIYSVRNISGLSRIDYTTDGGTTWDAMSAPSGNYVSDIVVDPLNAKHIFVTISGFGTGRVYSHNLETGIWTDETGGLPNIPVNCMVIDTNSQTQYVGTDAAVFYREKTSTDWTLFNENLPTVEITDLSINYWNNEIWAATYGRGMWKTPKYDVTPSSVNDIVPYIGRAIISPNPSHGTITIDTKNIVLRNVDVSVRLVAVDGKQVLSLDTQTDSRGVVKISTEGLPPGFYICDVSNSNGHSRGKVVVQ